MADSSACKAKELHRPHRPDFRGDARLRQGPAGQGRNRQEKGGGGAAEERDVGPGGLNPGKLQAAGRRREAFSFQIATDTQEETDRYWNAIVGNGGEESECGWCKDRWGLSWQITPRVLTSAMAAGGGEATRAFAAMMEMKKIAVAKIEAARRAPGSS